MVRHFLTIAWRNIRRRKTLSFIQIMCLSLGLAAFILVARYIQYEKDYDKFNENFDRIYRAQSYKIGDKMDDSNQTVVPLAKYLRDHVPEVENAITICEIWGEYLSPDAEHIYSEPDGFWAPSAIFDIFSFELIRGDKNTALDDINSIVLSETLAQKYFPGEDAMGKILLDNQKKELHVTGIMKDIPEQSSIEATYFRSNEGLLRNFGENWYNSSFRCMILLKPNVSVETVNNKISNVRNEFDKNAKQIVYLRPLAKLHLSDGPRDDRGVVIYFYSLIGILTLLLASVSFMNLTTSYSTLRSVEIGVRKVSGSNRNLIRIQFLLEAVVLAFISLIGAILLAYLLLPVFNSVVNRNINLELQQSPLFILFLLIAVLLTGFFGGSYPALVISALKPVMVLKSRTSFKIGKITGLQAMVYVQFILSVVLISSSLWMYRQVNFMKTKDLGFVKDDLLYCSLPEVKSTVSFQQFRERLLQYPGIEDVAISINSPLHSIWGTGIKYEDGPQDDFMFSRWNGASESYINTMGMQVIQGRNFSDEFPADQNSCLINETALKRFGWTNPIGKWVDIEGRKRQVIGVIKDFNIEDVHNLITPYVLIKREEGFGNNNDLTFKINPAAVEQSLLHINTLLTEIFPNILFEVEGFGAGTDRIALRIWNNAKNTFAFFTVLAVIIAAMGLFGLVVFASQRRVKEIGIRKVQGARAEQILPLITRQFVLFVLAANIISFPVGRLLEKITPGYFKYHFNITDVLIVLGISLLVTLASSGYQALKASRLNPVKALRYE